MIMRTAQSGTCLPGCRSLSMSLCLSYSVLLAFSPQKNVEIVKENRKQKTDIFKPVGAIAVKR